jgi:hypothetical protein
VVAVTAPRCACIVVVPATNAVAWPREPFALLMSAVAVVLDVQVTNEVTSSVLPSLNVPVAVKLTVEPARAVGFGGAIVKVDSVPAITVTAVLPATPENAAEIVDVPAATAVSRPLLPAASLTVATVGGPTLIEAVTYRLGAHSTSDDPARYRPDETEEWTRKDPITRFRAWLLASGTLDEPADAALRATIEEELREAIDAEENVGPPPIESLIEDVFAVPTTALREQLADLLRIRGKR